MAENTCIWNRCFHRIDPIERDDIFSKADIGQAISYFSRIEDLFIEKLKKETLRELWEFLVLYLDKREVYQTVKIPTE
jgi:transcription elongation factor GreA-like protein